MLLSLLSCLKRLFTSQNFMDAEFQTKIMYENKIITKFIKANIKRERDWS